MFKLYVVINLVFYKIMLFCENFLQIINIFLLIIQIITYIIILLFMFF